MSYQAVEWARRLPLPSSSLKFTLMTIGSYADTDDRCFPSLAKIAKDTVQSVGTVRRRLREAEQLGLLVQFERWQSPDGRVIVVAEDGSRPAECRQTSNEIRLLLNMTPDDVEAAITAWKGAGGEQHEQESEEQSAPDSPDNTEGEGVNLEGGEGVTATAPPGSHSYGTPGESQLCDPLNSNSNSPLNLTPQSPSSPSGEAATLPKEHFGEEVQVVFDRIEKSYPIPIEDVNALKRLLTAMTPEERNDVVLAAVGYRKFIADYNRKPMAADAFVRRDKWRGHVAAGRALVPKPPSPPPERIFVHPGTPEFAALSLANAVARRIIRMAFNQAGERGLYIEGKIPSGVEGMAALARFKDGSNSEIETNGWRIVDSGSQKFGAWKQRVREWVGIWPEPYRIWLDADENIVAHASLAARTSSGLPKHRDGFLVPPDETGEPAWPPRKSDDLAKTG